MRPVSVGKEWLSRPAALRVLGLGETSFERLVASGRITVRKFESSHARYRASDIDRLAEELTTPASVGGLA